MKQRYFLSLLIVLVIPFTACNRHPVGRLAGVEPVPDTYLFENHSESFPIWVEHHAKGRILVHVDGHLDLDWIPEKFIKDITSCRTAEELRKHIIHPYMLKAGFTGEISIWNFIYPAARSGIVREIYWIVPDGTFNAKNLLENIRSFLAIKLHGITPAELGQLKLSGNRITGTIMGIPMTVTELSSLPVINEVVLLDIDSDYFTTRSAIDQKVLLAPSIHPDEFIRRLSRKRLFTDIVTISYSSVGGFLPVPFHYFGNVLRERMRNPQSSKGEDDLKKEDQNDPVYQDSDLHMADALRGAGEMSEAIELYRKYIANPSSHYITYAKRRLGTALADSGLVEMAIEELKQLLSGHRDEPDARYYLGRLYKERKEIEHAVMELREAVALDPFNGIYATELGSCLLGLGEEADAIKWLHKGLELKPCNGNAFLNLAYHSYEKGDLMNAEGEFRNAIFVRPWDAGAHFMLGRIYYDQKKYMDAREEFMKTIKLAPDHRGARQALAALGY